VVIRGHSWSLVVIRGHSWSLVCTFRQDQSDLENRRDHCHLITSARRLCNHLGLYACVYVCVCVCVCVCVYVCVFVCEHDNSRNTNHIHTKFF
jgi:hypothetical protein